jgi:hypothetical protein
MPRPDSKPHACARNIESSFPKRTDEVPNQPKRPDRNQASGCHHDIADDEERKPAVECFHPAHRPVRAAELCAGRAADDKRAEASLPEEVLRPRVICGHASRTHQAGRPPYAAANPHSRCRAISPVVRWPGRAAARRLRSDRECAHRHPLRQDRHRLRHGDHPGFHHDLATINLRTAQCLVANRTRAAATSADIVSP